MNVKFMNRGSTSILGIKYYRLIELLLSRQTCEPSSRLVLVLVCVLVSVDNVYLRDVRCSFFNPWFLLFVCHCNKR